jgi:hypothetical protein
VTDRVGRSWRRCGDCGRLTVPVIAGIVYKCMVCYTEDDGDTSPQVAELRKTMFKNSNGTEERRHPPIRPSRPRSAPHKRPPGGS